MDALHTREVQTKLGTQGFATVGKCGADFGAILRKQYDDYGRIIREANIRAE
jgi:tripartite-type tricarboxylate transporter receptor subunit TctC